MSTPLLSDEAPSAAALPEAHTAVPLVASAADLPRVEGRGSTVAAALLSLAALRRTVTLCLILVLCTLAAAWLFSPRGLLLDDLFSAEARLGARRETVGDCLLASLLLSLFWLLGEVLHVVYANRIKRELDCGYCFQFNVVRNARRRDRADAGMPRARSAAWDGQLEGWLARRARQKTLEQEGAKGRAAAFYALYTACFVAAVLFTLLVTPQVPKTVPDVSSVGEYLAFVARGTFSMKDGSWYDLFLIAAVFIDLLIFLVAVTTVVWPRRNATDGVLLPEGPLHERKHGAHVKDACLMIACHKSCLTPERRTTFEATLRAALRVFPASHVFVCDNGGERQPADNTEDVVRELSREIYPDGSQAINYLYVCEGNKTHSMYWTTEYWIPLLVAEGKVPDFKYAVMIDDDVPLPPDLVLPSRMLDAQSNVKAVAFAICAATEDGSFNRLVALQDAEYKMAGLSKQLQAQHSSAFCAHGAIALWRRDILGKEILYRHDTAFHGEDMYMGVVMHRLARRYRMAVSAEAVVPTYAPEDWLTAFRQRTKSWDLVPARKIGSYLRELCRPQGFLVLKPYMFLEVVSILLDWTRPLFLVYIFHHDPASVVFCTLIFFSILWLELIAFNFLVLRHRADLRIGAMTIFLFPFYKTLLMTFRIYAVMENVINYTSWTKKPTSIAEREQSVQNLPPVPPSSDVDWSSVWTLPTSKEQGAGASDLDGPVVEYTRQLCDPLDIPKVAHKRRLSHVVHAYLLFGKLNDELARLGFPASMAALGGDGAMNAVVAFLQHDMETLRLRFDNKLAHILGSQWPAFRRDLDAILVRWQASPDTLVFRRDLAGQHPRQVFAVLTGTLRMFESVKAVLVRCHYPANHDEVGEIKLATDKLIAGLRGQVEKLQPRFTASAVVGEIVTALEKAAGLAAVAELRALGDNAEEEQQVRSVVAELHGWRGWLTDAGDLGHPWDAKVPELLASIDEQLAALGPAY